MASALLNSTQKLQKTQLTNTEVKEEIKAAIKNDLEGDYNGQNESQIFMGYSKAVSKTFQKEYNT